MNSLTGKLLQTLLDRHERPDRQRVVRVPIHKQVYPDYYSAHDASIRHHTNRTLAELATQGAIVLHWQRWEEGNWLRAIDLVTSEAAQIYQILKRTPRTQQELAVRALIKQQTPIAGWHAAFLAWAETQLDAQRSASPLDRDDLAASKDLLQALSAIAALHLPTLERTLSTHVFGDSKRLAMLRPRILRVLRQHNQDGSLLSEDDEALLRMVGVERVPQFIPMAGQIVFEPQLNIAAFVPSVALSGEFLRSARIRSADMQLVVTVENLTSFSDLSQHRPTTWFVIYTGGFASPALISFLQQIRLVAPMVEFAHWGDLDVGGLRILAHLRKHLGHITTIGMSADMLRLYPQQSQALSSTEQHALNELRNSALISDCIGLIDAMLLNKSKLEQEAIPASSLLI